jgi:hypothetical protein
MGAVRLRAVKKSCRQYFELNLALLVRDVGLRLVYAHTRFAL